MATGALYCGQLLIVRQVIDAFVAVRAQKIPVHRRLERFPVHAKRDGFAGFIGGDLAFRRVAFQTVVVVGIACGPRRNSRCQRTSNKSERKPTRHGEMEAGTNAGADSCRAPNHTPHPTPDSLFPHTHSRFFAPFLRINGNKRIRVKCEEEKSTVFGTFHRSPPSGVIANHVV